MLYIYLVVDETATSEENTPCPTLLGVMETKMNVCFRPKADIRTSRSSGAD